MRVLILAEYGVHQAMQGLALSYKVTSKIEPEKLIQHMLGIGRRLAHKGNGEGKFLESMMVWLEIQAPRYWWQQFDTYRVGVTKQSESTMHTILNRPFEPQDFQYKIPETYLDHLNFLRKSGKLEQLKNDLPEGFLQTRVVCLSYAALQRIQKQRGTHKLIEWRLFCTQIQRGVKFPEFIKEDKECPTSTSTAPSS